MGLWKKPKHTEVILSLTFDPVALVEADLSLRLSRVRTNHHKMSAGDGAVQLPPGTDRLAMTAGTDRGDTRHWSALTYIQ